jgi:hypothetical protein
MNNDIDETYKGVNMFKNLFVFIFIFIMGLSRGYGSDTFLLDVISEPENDKIHKFYLRLDANQEIISLIKTTDGVDEEIAFEDVVDGVVLIRREGFDVITLSCNNCHRAYGGEINLRYLHSGISREYRDFRMELIQEDDRWLLVDQKTEAEINAIKLLSKKFFGRIIGIERIQINP